MRKKIPLATLRKAALKRRRMKRRYGLMPMGDGTVASRKTARETR